MGYVYGIRTANAAEYFYIGSTKKPLQVRLTEHLAQVRAGTHVNRHFANKVLKAGTANIVIEAIEVCPDADRFALEYAHIKAFRERGVSLTNISDGEEVWNKSPGRYSLRENWEWAKQWYAHYINNRASLDADRDSTEIAVSSILASVIASILEAPPEDQDALIDSYS